MEDKIVIIERLLKENAITFRESLLLLDVKSNSNIQPYTGYRGGLGLDNKVVC